MLTLFLSLFCAASMAPAGQAAPAAKADSAGTEAEKAAIIETVLNYADGFYDGSAERMAKAVHPLLSKRGLLEMGSGTPRLSTMNSEMLIELARAGRSKVPAEQRGVKAEVLDVHGALASARVFTAQFDDYLHLMRTEDGWRIVNVLWRPPAKAPGDPDRSSPAAAARDCLALMAGKNGQGLLEVLHPAVSFRVVGPAPASPRLILQEALAENLAEIVSHGRMPLPANAGGTGEVTVLDVYEDIATVRMSAGPFFQYAHLARLDGRWRIVNTLTTIQQPK